MISKIIVIIDMISKIKLKFTHEKQHQTYILHSYHIYYEKLCLSYLNL